MTRRQKDEVRWLEAAGVRAAAIKPRLVFDSSHIAIEAALAGEGMALGLKPLVEDDRCGSDPSKPGINLVTAATKLAQESPVPAAQIIEVARPPCLARY